MRTARLALLAALVPFAAGAEMLFNSSFEEIRYSDLDGCQDPNGCLAPGRNANDVNTMKGGKDTGWRGNGNFPVISENAASVCEGKQGVTVYLNKWGQNVNGRNNHRTELRLTNLPQHNGQQSPGGGSMLYDTEYWLAFSLFIPEDFPINTIEREKDGASGPLIFQLHGDPDFHLGESWRNPPFNLNISKNERFNAKMRADPRPVTTKPYPVSRSYAGPLVDDYRGKWINVSMNFVQDPQNGWIDVYFDGEKVFEHKGGFGYNDRKGFYITMGNYTPAWRDKTREWREQVPFEESTHYFDDVRLAWVPQGERYTPDDFLLNCSDEPEPPVEPEPPEPPEPPVQPPEPSFEYQGPAKVTVYPGDGETGRTVVIELMEENGE